VTDAIAKPTTPSQPPASSARAGPRSVLDIQDVIRGMVRSAEPAVVLSSLARHSQLAFSDACAIELSEGTDALFQVSFPIPDEAVPTALDVPSLTGKTVTTAFRSASGHGYASFAGVAVHTWIGREPTADDAIIARLLVDYAMGIVQQERLTLSAACAEDRAAKLAVELITSRTEGEATGLLMARHRVTREEAVSMLRRSSGTAGRPPHEVAADMVRIRDLPTALRVTAGDPARAGLCAAPGGAAARPGLSAVRPAGQPHEPG